MRCRAAFVGAGLVLIAAAGCGSLQSPGGQSPSTTTPVSGSTASPTTASAPPTPTSPTVPVGSVAVPASQIDASGLPAGYPQEVYTANGGTVLSIRAEQGGCGQVTGAPVEQSAQRVVVDLVQTQGHPGQMCPMHIREVVVSVPLSAPLGARTVVLKAAH